MGGRSICPRCGTLVGIEFAAARARSTVKSVIDRQVSRFRPLQTTHFLWIAAFVPIVIVPPLISLGIALVSMRRADRPSERSNYEWIAIISVLNLLMSTLILYKFHFSLDELHGLLLGMIRSFIERIAPLMPGAPSSPRVIPI